MTTTSSPVHLPELVESPLAQLTAQAIITDHDLPQAPGEAPLTALGFALGDHITYETGLALFCEKALHMIRAQVLTSTAPGSPERIVMRERLITELLGGISDSAESDTEGE